MGKLMTCVVCGTGTQFILTEYQGVKVRPPRCSACVRRFPPKGVIINNEFRKTRRWMPRYLYHQWAIIAQDDIGEDWLCLRCRKILQSPGLGYPALISCNRGTEHGLKDVFWADISLTPVCPRCRRPATMVMDGVAYKYKITKQHFPYICEYC